MKKILSILALALAAMTASADTGYTLSVGTSEHGTIAFANAEGTPIQTAAEGDVVTVSITPDEGYVVNQPSGQWYAAVARARGVDVLNSVTLTPAGDNKWTFTMERANVEISATYIALPSELIISASNEDDNANGVNMVISATDDAAENVRTEQRINEATGVEETVTIIPIVLKSINIPATATEEIVVTVPGEIRQGSVVYEVTAIKADAFKKQEGSDKEVVKVILPETENVLTVEEGAMKPDGKLLDVVTPLQLLDDYSLMNTLKENFEASKISANVTPVNKYWTFSSGVDCVLPEGVTAYIAEWDAEFKTPRIIPLEEDQLKLKDGRRGIKANNGVLIAGEKDNTYEIVASPGNQESGTKPATTDAKSYEGNCLVPTIEAKNYEAGKYLVLKNNVFHTIKSNASKVKPCKAVFSLEKAK